MRIGELLIPACTFTRFLELPVEIQGHIWSIVAADYTPRILNVVPTTVAPKDVHMPVIDFASLIYCEVDNQAYDIRNAPGMLAACSLSRSMTREAYSSFYTCQYISAPSSGDAAYKACRTKLLNVSADTFYFGRSLWHNFTVLMDLWAMRSGHSSFTDSVKQKFDLFQVHPEHCRGFAYSFSYPAPTMDILSESAESRDCHISSH